MAKFSANTQTPRAIMSCKNFRKTTFTVGDKVCLSALAAEDPGQREVATILAFLGPKIEGGVYLDWPLEDFRFWNVDDLVLAKNVKGSQKKERYGRQK